MLGDAASQCRPPPTRVPRRPRRHWPLHEDWPFRQNTPISVPSTSTTLRPGSGNAVALPITTSLIELSLWLAAAIPHRQVEQADIGRAQHLADHQRNLSRRHPLACDGGRKSTDMRDILSHATLQAEGIEDYFLVDIDAHVTETQFWPEILERIDNDVIRQMGQAMATRPGVSTALLKPEALDRALQLHSFDQLGDQRPARALPETEAGVGGERARLDPFHYAAARPEFMMRVCEAPMLKRLPSEYIREMYFTSQPLEKSNMPPPDLILHGGKIITLDRSSRLAQAILETTVKSSA